MLICSRSEAPPQPLPGSTATASTSWSVCCPSPPHLRRSKRRRRPTTTWTPRKGKTAPPPAWSPTCKRESQNIQPGNNASKNMYSTNTYLSYAISHTFGSSVFSITDSGEATKYRTCKTKRCAEDLNYKKSESTNALNNHACEQHFFLLMWNKVYQTYSKRNSKYTQEQECTDRT